MNEIERFKKNRMIPKGLYGLKPHEILGAKINGEKVVYINIPGKGYLAVDGKGNAYTTVNESSVGSFDPGRSSFKPVRLTNYDRLQIYNAVTNGKVSSMFSSTGSTVTGITDYWKALGAPTVTPTAPTLAVATSPDTNKEPLRLVYSAQQQLRLNAGRITGRSRITPRGQQYWDDEFAKFTGGLSQEQQDWLKTNGLNNATKLQEYLNNMGFSVGKFGVDGKFSNDSKTAWNNFVASGTMGKNNDLEILAKQLAEQPVIDAPDPFGYKTENHYGDGAALKNMGFSNYAGLQKFAAGDDLFAKDLRQRFGQDVNKWDQATVEGALGVSGRYRGSNSGDFGDMARSMQNWAAQQNATYDLKLNDARMDVARQQLATKMAQQYTTQLTKPTAPKFITNNFGINTLGDIDGLKGDPIYGKWVE